MSLGFWELPVGVAVYLFVLIVATLEGGAAFFPSLAAFCIGAGDAKASRPLRRYSPEPSVANRSQLFIVCRRSVRGTVAAFPAPRPPRRHQQQVRRGRRRRRASLRVLLPRGRRRVLHRTPGDGD